MQENRKNNFTPEFAISLLVVALVSTFLATSYTFADFAQRLGIDSDFGVTLFAGSIAFLVGIVLFRGLKKLLRKGK